MTNKNNSVKSKSIYNYNLEENITNNNLNNKNYNGNP